MLQEVSRTLRSCCLASLSIVQSLQGLGGQAIPGNNEGSSRPGCVRDKVVLTLSWQMSSWGLAPCQVGWQLSQSVVVNLHSARAGSRL